MLRTKSIICSSAAAGGLMTMSTPSPSTLSSESVTSAATSTRASASRSRPVISQSIHTRRSFTPAPYGQGRRVPSSDVREWAGLVARLVVGVVWVWAGAAKVLDPLGSIEAVRAYELLPASLVEPVGYALPALELVLGLALLVGAMTRGAALLSAVLLVGFVVGIASAWARGLEIDCGCFGGGGVEAGASSEYPLEIARDVGLLALSLLLVWLRSTRLALDGLLFRRTTVRPAPAPDDVPEGAR